MLITALITSIAVSLVSLTGVFLFGHDKRLAGIERFAVPVAVGVFLSIVLYELIPETIEEAPVFGGIVVALGFIGFYILSSILHQKYHDTETQDCDRKNAATLLLVGDSIHNLADGFILGAAFLIDPALGIATAIGLAAHEVPQEIVEFGVLLRAGYTRAQAAVRNLLSASSIIIGTMLVILISEQASEYVWILTGFAAGSLLYLSSSDLLPRIHGNLKNYGSVWHSTVAIIVGFIIMTSLITWTNSEYGPDQNNDLIQPNEHFAEQKI